MSYAVAAKAARSGQLTGRWTREEHEAFLAGLEEHVSGYNSLTCLFSTPILRDLPTFARHLCYGLL